MVPDSVRLKIIWSKKHLDTLDSEIEQWRSGSRNPFRLQRIRDGVPLTEFRAKVRFDPTIPDSIPLLIGDAVHNLRSALDHLACALVNTKGPSTYEAGRTRIEFPIFADQVKFKSNGASKIRKMDTEARKEIEAVQPYHAGDNARSGRLWILHQLDIIDKHRQITIMGGRYSLPASFQPKTPSGEEIVVDGRIYVPFKDGDIIRLVDVDPGFQPDLKGAIACRWEDGAHRILDIGALRLIHEHVAAEVVPRFARFFA